ncbi:MAG: hypothetical protein KC422_08610 [Trueperaceae bacterium]|nr:hypothetical protein [Trueperaceae bacterium]
MLKWLRVLRTSYEDTQKRETAKKIKRDLDTYQKWSRRKLSDRLSN